VKDECRHFDFGDFSQDFHAVPARFDRNLTADAVTFGVNDFVGNVYTPLK
jgi:hypothetical protein